MKPSLSSIDLNCDMGEGIGNDAAIMPFISSANIACGYHAGNEETIWNTIELALKHNVAIGAHVSFLDKENFGRTEMMLDKAEIYELVTQQLLIISDIAASINAVVRHIKPHGALYNMSAKDSVLARTIAEAVRDFNHELILFGLSSSHSIGEANEIGLKTASEVFADRAYLSDGSLVPRSQEGSLLNDVHAVLAQVDQIVKKQCLESSIGTSVPVQADTICIHGDGAHAELFAKAIHDHLKQEKIDIKAK